MPFYDENTNPVEVDAGPQFGSANYDFSFLDNYLQSVGKPTRTNPDQVIDDGSDFYEEAKDADEPDSQESQLPHQSDDDATKAEDNDQFNNQGMESYLFGDDEHMAMLNDLLNYRNDEDEEAPDATGEPVNGTPGTPGSLGNQISAKETQGKYTATNAHSSATGKYQFLWSAWGDSIKKVTGVKSQKDFLNNPQAQEKYYSFYEKSYLLPIAKKIKQQTGTNLTDDQVAKLVHFRGEGGAKKYLKGQLPDKPEAHNMAISAYIKQAGGVPPTVAITKLNPAQQQQYSQWRSQLPQNLQYEGNYDLKGLWLSNPNVKPSSNMHFPDTYKLPNHPTFSNESIYFNNKTKPFAGRWQETDSSWNYIPYNPAVKDTVIEHKQTGGIAYTPEQQFVGLNDPSLDTLMLPLTGTNTIRGLDSGEPVHVKDETGKFRILRGPKDTVRMTGKVYEKRLKKVK